MAKEKLKIGEWAVFGAIYGALVGVVLAIVLGLFAGLVFENILIGLIAGIIVIPIMAIIGAIGWVINSFIYGFVRKYIQKYSVWMQVAALGLIQNVGWKTFEYIRTGPDVKVISLDLILAVAISAWVLVKVAGFFKIKIPIKKKGR